MRRILGASLLAPFLGLAGASPVVACSCLPPPPPVIALIGADAVFEGIVTAIKLEVKADEDPNSISSADLMRVSFRVLRAWKGLETAEAVVFTARDSASCGYDFEIGVRYLVYASQGRYGLGTGACSRTDRASGAHEDFRDIGAPKWEAEP